MNDLEHTIRTALHHRLQLARQPDVERWDDEAVAVIMHAAAGDVLKAVAAEPSEVTEVAQAAEVQIAAERVAELEQLNREMLAAFAKGPNGWSARVKEAQVEQWQERLGGVDLVPGSGTS